MITYNAVGLFSSDAKRFVEIARRVAFLYNHHLHSCLILYLFYGLSSFADDDACFGARYHEFDGDVVREMEVRKEKRQRSTLPLGHYLNYHVFGLPAVELEGTAIRG